MSFVKHLDTLPIDTLIHKSLATSSEEVKQTIDKNRWSHTDLPTLLSPAAIPYLERMAQKAKKLTEQRFGNTMQLFIPMYLSNECYNNCTYCGFSMKFKYPRVTLSDKEILAEAKILKEKGFKHLLVLTGEAPGKVGEDYISHAIKLLSPHFSSIGIEIQPLRESGYTKMIQAGSDSLTLYQETYHREAYAHYHTAGKKRNYDLRLNAVEEGGKAGFYRLNIGALLGLHDWRYEAFALGEHLTYLQKTYWKSKLSVSFPRIQKMVGPFKVEDEVTDTDLVQCITAFRLCFPDSGITLSTREPAWLRDRLIHLGITSMSAESHTEPGGYSGKKAEKQFEISDERSLADVEKMLIESNFEPVYKDWDPI